MKISRYFVTNLFLSFYQISNLCLIACCTLKLAHMTCLISTSTNQKSCQNLTTPPLFQPWVAFKDPSPDINLWYNLAHLSIEMVTAFTYPWWCPQKVNGQFFLWKVFITRPVGRIRLPLTKRQIWSYNFSRGEIQEGKSFWCQHGCCILRPEIWLVVRFQNLLVLWHYFWNEKCSWVWHHDVELLYCGNRPQLMLSIWTKLAACFLKNIPFPSAVILSPCLDRPWVLSPWTYKIFSVLNQNGSP